MNEPFPLLLAGLPRHASTVARLADLPLAPALPLQGSMPAGPRQLLHWFDGAPNTWSVAASVHDASAGHPNGVTCVEAVWPSWRATPGWFDDTENDANV